MNMAICTPLAGPASRPRAAARSSVGRAAFGWQLVSIVCLLSGCDGAPSRNILGSYFPSWMLCALGGITLALATRAIFKLSGIIEELPVPFIVLLSIACAGTFALWLVWLA